MVVLVVSWISLVFKQGLRVLLQLDHWWVICSLKQKFWIKKKRKNRCMLNWSLLHRFSASSGDYSIYYNEVIACKDSMLILLIWIYTVFIRPIQNIYIYVVPITWQKILELVGRENVLFCWNILLTKFTNIFKSASLGDFFPWKVKKMFRVGVKN